MIKVNPTDLCIHKSHGCSSSTCCRDTDPDQYHIHQYLSTLKKWTSEWNGAWGESSVHSVDHLTHAQVVMQDESSVALKTLVFLWPSTCFAVLWAVLTQNEMKKGHDEHSGQEEHPWGGHHSPRISATLQTPTFLKVQADTETFKLKLLVTSDDFKNRDLFEDKKS